MQARANVKQRLHGSKMIIKWIRKLELLDQIIVCAVIKPTALTIAEDLCTGKIESTTKCTVTYCNTVVIFHKNCNNMCTAGNNST